MFNLLWQDFIALIYPDPCLSCALPLNKGERIVCTACAMELPFTNFHLLPESPLMVKFYGKTKISEALAFLTFIKSGKVQKLLHHLKYKGRSDVGEYFGRWYGRILLENGKNNYDLIVPVPMHVRKLKKRGYNQADFFAKGLSDATGIIWSPDVLLKISNTASQTRKNRFDRWLNTEEVFSFNTNYNVEGKKILLVDDVITTGSTLEACANILLDRGASAVSVCTIAQA